MRCARFLARWIVLKPVLNIGFRIRVHEKQNLAKLRGYKTCIVVANHTSHLDAPLLMNKLPWRVVRNIATASAMDFWFKSRLRSLPMRLLMNTFPVERGETNRYKGLSKQLLSENLSLLVMPEGKRSRSGKMGEFNTGTAALAIRYQIPILPIAIVGAFEAWHPDSKMWRSGRPVVHVVFTPPLTPKKSETVDEFNDRIWRAIRQTYDKTARKCDLPTQDEIG